MLVDIVGEQNADVLLLYEKAEGDDGVRPLVCGVGQRQTEGNSRAAGEDGVGGGQHPIC